MRKVILIALIAMFAMACANQYGVFLVTPDEFVNWIRDHRQGASWKDLDNRSPLHWTKDGGGELNEVLDGLVEAGRLRVEGKTGPNTGYYYTTDYKTE